MNKTVLLLGGTGAMGEPLQKYLLDSGYNVYVTSRKEHDSEGINFFIGNAHDKSFLMSILSAHHFDAIVDFMVYKTEEFADVLKTMLMYTAQYIFISSARVYAPSDSFITEDSPRLLDICDDKQYLLTDEYALSKARQEDILMSSGFLNWTIVRPSLTYNTKRLQYPLGELEEWLTRVLLGNSVIFPRDMLDIYTTMSDGNDVALAISKLVCNERALGQAVHIAGAKAVTWGEVMDIYSRVLKVERQLDLKVKYVDGYEKISKDLGRYYQIKYARAISRCFDNSKLYSIVGEMGFISAQDGLKKCLREYLNEVTKMPALSSRAMAYFDKFTHEITPLKCFSTFKSKIKYVILRWMLF